MTPGREMTQVIKLTTKIREQFAKLLLSVCQVDTFRAKIEIYEFPLLIAIYVFNVSSENFIVHYGNSPSFVNLSTDSRHLIRKILFQKNGRSGSLLLWLNCKTPRVLDFF